LRYISGQSCAGRRTITIFPIQYKIKFERESQKRNSKNTFLFFTTENTEDTERRFFDYLEYKKTLTIQLPNPNNSALDNIALRMALPLQPLFIKFPLVANNATKRALMLLFFGYFHLQNIRA
jgi:hypothetical protein